MLFLLRILIFVIVDHFFADADILRRVSRRMVVSKLPFKAQKVGENGPFTLGPPQARSP